MALFDKLSGGLGGLLNSGLAGAMMSGLPAKLQAALAASPYGDLDGLLERFREAGFGEEVASWLSQGENRPLTREQIMEAVDPMTMGDLAAAIGVPAPMLPGLMAQYLPVVVDKLSPHGTLEMPKL
ncbi:YidB family protein [Aquabacter sp. P-9]|uniref:YidB family protein n=1 Tax=Aquabacter sediminis TaxID=3029197 RepID=UPI00237ED601|nr:YidB family protein [Aquabacter sp. P-9]MDE1568150.1 YidB family protein [Aquabacter sp. P-9]